MQQNFKNEKEKIKFENEFYKKNLPLIKGIIIKDTSNYELAEELSVEVMVKAFKSLDKYNEEIPLNRWLYKITKNHLIDYYRKRAAAKNKIYKNLCDIDSFIDDNNISIYDLDDNFLMEEFMTIINGLDESDKTIFNLSFLEGKTIEQISDLTSLKPNTIKSKIWRLKKDLKEEFKN